MLEIDKDAEEKVGTINGDGYEFSPEADKIIPAFIEMQWELDTAKKTSENPFFKSKYSDLNEVMRALKDPFKNNGFAVSWFCTMMPYVDAQLKDMAVGQYNKLVWNGNWITIRVREIKVTTLLLHMSGQYIKTWLILIPNDNDNQTKGKAITYGKRYSITSLTGLCSEEDNDGNLNNTKNEGAPSDLTTDNKKKDPPLDKYIEVAGIKRYNKTNNNFDDNYQSNHGLISTKEWRKLQDMINKKLGGNFTAFEKWLKGIYKVCFYEIKVSMFTGIFVTLDTNPHSIIDYSLDDEK